MQDSSTIQSQNSFTGYDDSLFSYYGISQPATLDTNDKENFNSENTTEPVCHSLDITVTKPSLKPTTPLNQPKKSFYEAVVSNSISNLKSSGSTDQFDSFFASKMTDIVKSSNNDPIPKPKLIEQSLPTSSDSKLSQSNEQFINTFKMPETTIKPNKNENDVTFDKNNAEEEPRRKLKTSTSISVEAEATNEKFNKFFNRESSNISNDITSSLLIPSCFDYPSSNSTPGFNFAALNNDVRAIYIQGGDICSINMLLIEYAS